MLLWYTSNLAYTTLCIMHCLCAALKWTHAIWNRFRGFVLAAILRTVGHYVISEIGSWVTELFSYLVLRMDWIGYSRYRQVTISEKNVCVLLARWRWRQSERCQLKWDQKVEHWLEQNTLALSKSSKVECLYEEIISNPLKTHDFRDASRHNSFNCFVVSSGYLMLIALVCNLNTN